MLNMKKALAVTVLSAALLIPGIAEAQTMGPMEPKAMMETSAMTEQSAMMAMKGLVPLRLFAETLGYTIMWNKDDRSITLTYMGTNMNMGMMGEDEDMQMSDSSHMSMNDRYTIKLMPDSNVIMVGTDKMMLKQSPMLIDGSVYISKDTVTSYLLAPFMMKSMS